jgi:hypothetical protein
MESIVLAVIHLQANSHRAKTWRTRFIAHVEGLNALKGDIQLQYVA